MSARTGLAVILGFVIILCVVMVNSPTISREEYRAYKARRQIEGALDVAQELAKMESSRQGGVRLIQPESPAAYQPTPSLPPSVLGR